nr:MAG TPA: hypothetical protein [Caudoviricetes sp.]
MISVNLIHLFIEMVGFISSILTIYLFCKRECKR